MLGAGSTGGADPGLRRTFASSPARTAASPRRASTGSHGATSSRSSAVTWVDGAQGPRSSRGSLVPRGLGRFGSVGGNGNDLLGADAWVRGEQLGCDRLDIRSLDLGDCPEVDEIAHADRHDGNDRDSEDRAPEARDAGSDEKREENKDRVQADAVAHEPRLAEVHEDRLDPEEDDRDRDEHPGAEQG